MLLVGRGEMLVAEAPYPLPWPVRRPRVDAEANEDRGHRYRRPRQPPLGTPAKPGPLVARLHPSIRHDLRDVRVAYGPFHDLPAGLRGGSIRPHRAASGQRGAPFSPRWFGLGSAPRRPNMTPSIQANFPF